MTAFRNLATFVVVSSAVALAVWPAPREPIADPEPAATAPADAPAAGADDRLPADARVVVFEVGGATGAVALDGAAGRRFRDLLGGAEVLVRVDADGGGALIRTVSEGQVVPVATEVLRWADATAATPRIDLLRGPRPEP